MKSLYTFLKDLKLAFRTFYIYIEFAMALIFIAVILFVIPENFSDERSFYVALDLEGPARTFVEERLTQSPDAEAMIITASRAEIEMALEEDRNGVGLLVTQESGKLVYDFILQGYESQRLVNILERAFMGEVASELPDFVDRTEVVTLTSVHEKLSDRLDMLPVFLVLNSALMGFFIIASYIFLDKDEGTIRALTVTPAKVSDYLLAKMGMMLFAGLITGMVTVAAVAGQHVNYLHMFFILTVSNLFGTALGLMISSFFDTITKAMGMLFVSIIVLAFSTVSYYLPSFSPLVIRMLPTYPMLFAFRETLYAQPNVGYIYTVGGGLLAATVVLFLIANDRFKKTLTV